MNNRLLLAVGAGALTVLLTACGSAPTALALADACTDAHDDTSVAVEGYLTSRSSVSCNDYDGTYRCMIDLSERAGDDHGTQVGVDIPVGTGGSQMDEPADDFTDASLVLRDHTGADLRVGDRVRATGELTVAPSDVCFVSVDTLERA